MNTRYGAFPTYGLFYLASLAVAALFTISLALSRSIIAEGLSEYGAAISSLLYWLCHLGALVFVGHFHWRRVDRNSRQVYSSLLFALIATALIGIVAISVAPSFDAWSVVKWSTCALALPIVWLMVIVLEDINRFITKQ